MAEASLRPCCLVIEDQALIGMAIEAYLEDVGYAIGGPFCSGAEALAWLDTNTPDAAVLDFVLRDGPVTDLARELSRRGVPFIVYSGRPKGPGTPSELQAVPWIEKPADRADLLQALTEVLPSPRTHGNNRQQPDFLQPLTGWRTSP